MTMSFVEFVQSSKPEATLKWTDNNVKEKKESVIQSLALRPIANIWLQNHCSHTKDDFVSIEPQS